MPRDPDTLETIEEKASLTQARLRQALATVGARSPVSVAGSMLQDRLSTGAKEMAEAIKPAFRGWSGLWSCAIVGAALSFELGRASAKPAPVSLKDRAATAEMSANEDPASIAGGVKARGRSTGKSIRTLLLAAGGLAGGFVLSAITPAVRGEAQLRTRVSGQLREKLREVVGANGAGIVKIVLNSTGLSRRATVALVIVSLMIEALSGRDNGASGAAGVKPAE